jgi:head-tail adaptor
MTTCETIRMKHRRLCAGDLDRKIILKSRTLTTPQDSEDFEQVMATVKTVWAGLSSTKGKQMFGTTNMDNGPSHVFYVRWFAGLTAEYWVEYKGENYNIIDVENLDERDEWAALYCNVRGDSDSEVNLA